MTRHNAHNTKLIYTHANRTYRNAEYYGKEPVNVTILARQVTDNFVAYYETNSKLNAGWWLLLHKHTGLSIRNMSYDTLWYAQVVAEYLENNLDVDWSNEDQEYYNTLPDHVRHSIGYIVLSTNLHENIARS